MAVSSIQQPTIGMFVIFTVVCQHSALLSLQNGEEEEQCEGRWFLVSLALVKSDGNIRGSGFNAVLFLALVMRLKSRPPMHFCSHKKLATL